MTEYFNFKTQQNDFSLSNTEQTKIECCLGNIPDELFFNDNSIYNLYYYTGYRDLIEKNKILETNLNTSNKDYQSCVSILKEYINVLQVSI
jgi:hypothetical protein